MKFIPTFFYVETIVYGTGKHYIIMLHGLGSSPNEFKNLYPLINSTRYKMIIPSMNYNAIMSLEETTDWTYQVCKHHIKDWSNVESLSFIGNSLGGLVAKKLLDRMSHELLLHNHVKLENFITLVTPHKGIGNDFSLMNLLRMGVVMTLLNDHLAFSLLLGKRTENEINTTLFLTMIKKFKNKTSYALSSFDSNVPLWSATLQDINQGKKFYKSLTHDGVVSLDRHKVKFFVASDDSLDNGDSNMRSQHGEISLPINGKMGYYKEITEITEIEIEDSNINWKLVFIPMNSWLNHGNVVGKHLHNTWITPDKRMVANCLKHITDNFKE